MERRDSLKVSYLESNILCQIFMTDNRRTSFAVIVIHSLKIYVAGSSREGCSLSKVKLRRETT